MNCVMIIFSSTRCEVEPKVQATGNIDPEHVQNKRERNYNGPLEDIDTKPLGLLLLATGSEK